KALSATSIAGGFLVFLYEKNWLEAIIKFFEHQKQTVLARFRETNSFAQSPTSKVSTNLWS
ncbi:hypothetical protein, partial [Streptococcus suis]|uniref:hypothetical protein n=1 Tax=Streptococcus suis TaxID=1307 RepID=UPI003F102629